MRFLKQQNLNKYRRTDLSVSSDTIGRINMRTTSTLLLPKGPQSSRPLTPENGQIRYNTDLQDIEVYVNGYWKQLRYSEPSPIIQQSLGYGDYVQKQFGPLNPIPVAGQNIIVLVENVIQIHNINYVLSQVSGNWYIEFDEAPPSKLITVLHNFDK